MKVFLNEYLSSSNKYLSSDDGGKPNRIEIFGQSDDEEGENSSCLNKVSIATEESRQEQSSKR